MSITTQKKSVGRLSFTSSRRGATLVELTARIRGVDLPVIKTTPFGFEDFFYGSWPMLPPGRTGRSGKPGEFSWLGKHYTTGSGKYKSEWGIHGPLCRTDLEVIETETGYKYFFCGAQKSRIFPELWPFRFEADIEYSISGMALICRMNFRNISGAIAPMGCGFHTFFPHQVVPGAPAELRMPAESYYRKRKVIGAGNQHIALPEGEPLEIPKKHDYSNWSKVRMGHDDAYCHVQQPVGIRWKEVGLSLELCSEEYLHYTLFSPVRHKVFRPQGNTGYFAVEPQTCLANALVLEKQGINSGIKAVPHQGTLSATLEVRVNETF